MNTRLRQRPHGQTRITDLTFGTRNVQTMLQPGKMMEVADGKLHATRRRGRPGMRWLDDVSMDLRKMGINEWRDRARNRETWMHILAEAKAHQGL